MKKLAVFLVGTVGLFAADPAVLAQKCMACHGVNFEKAPLGETHHVIKGDSLKKIADMIKYYQHPKEADEKVMQEQVKGLKPDEIKALSEYIYKKTQGKK